MKYTNTTHNTTYKRVSETCTHVHTEGHGGCASPDGGVCVAARDARVTTSHPTSTRARAQLWTLCQRCRAPPVASSDSGAAPPKPQFKPQYNTCLRPAART